MSAARNQISNQYFLVIGEVQYGPLSIEDIQGYLAEGRVAATDLVWAEGFGDWVELQSAPDFTHLFERAPEKPRLVPPSKTNPTLTRQTSTNPSLSTRTYNTNPNINRVASRKQIPISDALEKILNRVASRKQIPISISDAPERIGMLWAAYYLGGGAALFSLLFFDLIPEGENFTTFLDYAFDGNHEAWGNSLFGLMILASVTPWVQGAKGWLAERVGILLFGAAIAPFTYGFLHYYGGFSAIGSRSHSLPILIPAFFFFVMAPIATLSVLRLSLHDRFRTKPRSVQKANS